MKKVRVRFPPSPTGELHIGGLRTALYNFLYAKQNNADLVLRIEDTDQKRFVEGSAERMQEILKELGIKWQDGPIYQSKRLDIYKEHAEKLVKDGKAYYCFCEPERLEKMREEQIKNKRAPRYDQFCLNNVSPDEINKKLNENCPHTIRLKVPEGETIEFYDMVRGKISFDTDTLDHQVLMKSDGYPTYHLASIVDDHLMEVSHVIRGEEWLPSTPKHILLYRAFGWDAPEFAHLPLLLGKDKKKLSKRQADVSVQDYLDKGYLPEALINFVALLGWNPGEGSVQEIFSMDQLVSDFRIEKVHKSGAVFDIDKLNWINSQYIKKMSIDELYEKSKKFWKVQKDEKFLKKVLEVEKDRLNNLSEVGEGNEFFFKDINYDKELLRWKDMSDEALKKSLQSARDSIEEIDGWNREKIKKILIKKAGDNRGEFLWPLRASLTGQEKSPSPFDVVWVLGKEESINRIDKAINLV